MQRRAGEGRLLSQWLAFLRRLIYSALIVLIIVYLSFFGLDLSRGGSSYDAVLSAGAHTLQYLRHLFQGDLGTSTSVRGAGRLIPVAEVLPTMLINSLALLAVALLLSTVIGTSLGLWSVRRQRRSISLFALTLSLVGVSLPSFFVALLLQIGVIFMVRDFGWKPFPVGGFGWDNHIILPALVLAARPIAQISRVTSVTLIEVLGRDFVRTASAKGLSGRWVRWRHVYPNIAIPILTTIGSSLRFSLSSLPVVELFFSWPGVGFNLLRAIARKDDTLTVGLVTCLGILFIAVNWLLDAIFRRLDPRLRDEEQRTTQSEQPFWKSWQDTLSDLRYRLTQNRLMDRMRGRRRDAEAAAGDQRAVYRQIVAERLENGSAYDIGEADRRRERRRAWERATLRNPPLMLGGAILMVLLVLVVLGPKLSPQNPYKLVSMEMVEGRLTTPPFEPSERYPWGSDVIGRDIMSLVFTGAGRTLSLAMLVVLARLLVGFLLGAIAGWSVGSQRDRLVVGLSETIAAFPSLILAMILILALGIRQGPKVFVIALCFVGWGEVMHYVRNQVMALRPQTFIEGAVATGLRAPKIILSHVFPNLVSPMIALGALEMGATLMLLGELGFVGIFIGGGALVELMADRFYHYSDVPEWGALLSNMRLYARSYPWTAIYPSLAFFVSILGFNFLGEGLRLLIERVGVGFTRVLNRYTLVGGAIFVAAIFWVRGNVGPWQFFRAEARSFQADRALADIEYLAGRSLAGRRLDTPGIEMAADYIADQFRQAGLNPGGEELSYFYQERRDYASYTAMPEILARWPDGSSEELTYQRDFTVYPALHFMSGWQEGEVVFMATGQLESRYSYALGSRYPALDEAQLDDSYLLVTKESFQSLENGSADMRLSAGKGFLVIADSPDELRRYSIPSAHAQGWGDKQQQAAAVKPVFLISRELASKLLGEAGEDLDALIQQSRRLGKSEVVTIPTGALVQGSIRMEAHQKIPVRHVIATMTGMNADYDQKLIVVAAPYDGLGIGPDGQCYPGANDPTSAVAALLEIIRSWKEQNYYPDKSFMFVAYAAGGYPYAQAPTTLLNPARFIEARYAYKDAFELEAIVELGPVGAGSGNQLMLWTGGNQLIGDLFYNSARSLGVKARRSEDDLDIGLLFTSTGVKRQLQASGATQRAPTLGLSWGGSQILTRTSQDTPEIIHLDTLQDAGQAISLALMTLGRAKGY